MHCTCSVCSLVTAAYMDFVRNAHVDKDVIVQTFNSVHTISKKQHAENLPTLLTSRMDIELAGKWAETVNDERFLVPSDSSNVIIFASDDNLR